MCQGHEDFLLPRMHVKEPSEICQISVDRRSLLAESGDIFGGWQTGLSAHVSVDMLTC